MDASNSDISRMLGLPLENEKLCTIKYISKKTNTTVAATGRLTTLEKLREDFPRENIQICREDNIEYYKRIFADGPHFFAIQWSVSKQKAYYWDNGSWYGYRTLESIDFYNESTANDSNVEPAQQVVDDRPRYSVSIGQ